MPSVPIGMQQMGTQPPPPPQAVACVFCLYKTRLARDAFVMAVNKMQQVLPVTGLTLCLLNDLHHPYE